MSEPTGGNWSASWERGAVVTDDPTVGPNDDHREHYGGGVICESISNPADANLIITSKKLLAACKAQHDAIDRLMAMLIARDSSFMPTRDKAIWDACLLGNSAVEQAEGGAS